MSFLVKKKICNWVEEPGGEFWKSDCGMAFRFDTGHPKENGFKYCPKCGKVLSQKSTKS